MVYLGLKTLLLFCLNFARAPIDELLNVVEHVRVPALSKAKDFFLKVLLKKLRYSCNKKVSNRAHNPSAASNSEQLLSVGLWYLEGERNKKD